jgi:predicted ATPase/class 3 adenylate cyclase
VDPSTVTTFLFTDIEGSSRLWEQEPGRMPHALARHDALARRTVERHRGTVVKMTGDGLYAAFEDPLDAVGATIELQQVLDDPAATEGIALRVRCGMHAGVVERRDNDYFGSSVNRAARIMGTAHGGQVVLSQTVADLVRDRLPGDVSLRDLGSVRLRDLANPERVYQIVHPRLRQDFPALRSLEATPNNLPPQATTFVGREREVADVSEALHATRLLTLVGAGGIGKTRLSLQVAADLLDESPDGVWFVELAPLTDAHLVPQAVASALGVKEETGRPVTEALVEHVVDRQLLLVLDNCEHLVEACATLADRLLRAGPRLRILASSRQPLRVSGEATFQVPALGVPAPQDRIAADAMPRYPAVQLFVDRATSARPAFRLTDHNAGAVAAICRHLDGIPLAIELAAARMRALSVENIADRLSDRFHLLTGGNRTALPRQQTLRALIDWSHDLLDEQERILFRRLAVFAGGWTLDAAEAVGAGDGLRQGDVLDRLTDLVDKSLVTLNPEAGRYELLETIRQYAEERLDAAGEGGAVRTRHLAHYLAMAEAAKTKLVGPEQAEWLARLDLDRENLLAAHAWCDRAEGGATLGLRLVNAIKEYWFRRGLLRLGKRATQEALSRPGAQARDLPRSLALFGVGQLCAILGEYGEAVGHLEESLAIARELGDRYRVAATLQPLGLAAVGQGDLARGRGYFEEALALAQEVGDAHQVASAANAVAQLHRMEGDLAGAEPLYAQVIAMGRQLGHPQVVAVGLLNVSMVHIERGAHGGARLALQEVIAIAEATKSMPAGQSALEVAAGLAAELGEPERALRYFAAAEATALATGIRRDPADDAFLQPLIGKARNALTADVASAAERAGGTAGYDVTLADVRAWLARPG